MPPSFFLLIRPLFAIFLHCLLHLYSPIQFLSVLLMFLLSTHSMVAIFAIFSVAAYTASHGISISLPLLKGHTSLVLTATPCRSPHRLKKRVGKKLRLSVVIFMTPLFFLHIHCCRQDKIHSTSILAKYGPMFVFFWKCRACI